MRETVLALATVLCLKSLTLQWKDLDWVCSQQCRIPDVFHGSKPGEKNNRYQPTCLLLSFMVMTSRFLLFFRHVKEKHVALRVNCRVFLFVSLLLTS